VVVALLLLALVLGFAVIRPGGWPEAVAAVPAAGLLIVSGTIPLREADAEVIRLLPVVAFLAAVLVLAKLCDDEGLFHAAGVLMARTSVGKPSRLLVRVFVIAAATTAVLSLDATVVLLTPVVLRTARTLKIPARPHAYATAHLANTASLLLPVSNLTNLLAFAAAGLSFTRFTVLMTAPWLIAIAVEYLILRWFFAADLRVQTTEDIVGPVQATQPEAPAFVLAVLGVTLVGFAVSSLAGIAPAWSALAGCLVLGARSLTKRHSTVAGLVSAVNIPFLVFVLALGVVVDAVMASGLDSRMRSVLPAGTTLLALLGIAVVAAVLANVVNNLPAVLVLLPLVAAAGPAGVLAVLVGVNIGPNLSYAGSLANLLWRRVLHREGVATSVGEFSRVGLCTVPIALVTAVVALWAGLRIVGG
jgi:arsenical pump membrane protein